MDDEIGQELPDTAEPDIFDTIRATSAQIDEKRLAWKTAKKNRPKRDTSNNFAKGKEPVVDIAWDEYVSALRNYKTLLDHTIKNRRALTQTQLDRTKVEEIVQFLKADQTKLDGYDEILSALLRDCAAGFSTILMDRLAEPKLKSRRELR